MGFDIGDMAWEVACVLDRSEWVGAVREEPRAVVEFESFAWRRVCRLADVFWSLPRHTPGRSLFEHFQLTWCFYSGFLRFLSFLLCFLFQLRQLDVLRFQLV